MIKTIQGKAIQAYKVIEKLSGGNMPLPVAYKFFKMRKALMPQYEFQIEEERKLLEKCGAIHQDGSWMFESEQGKNEFIELLDKIGKIEVDVDMEKQSISLDTNIELSIEDMEALDGFVNFE